MSHLGSEADHGASYLLDPRFLVGVTLFVCGMAINIQSDNILTSLRKPGESGYKIPRGGCFEWVSGANFFGEILEWAGWSIACWNPVAAAFAFFTFCNIGPRGAKHHETYLEKFDDYPRHRRRVIPYIW